MENKVILNFQKALTGLAGYQYGLSEYQKQVEGKIDFSKKIVIEFPDNIERLASSFIQGFFGEFVRQIGISGIEEKVEIISRKKDMKDTIIKNLL